MATLLIALPPEAPGTGAVLDCVLSNDALSVLQYASVPWGQLPAWSRRSADVVLVLPMAALSWHRVRLPQGSLPRAWGLQQGWTRLRAILDGLLEEKLLDEPAAVHLCLQPDAATVDEPWVMACARAWLSDWLAALAQSGLQVKRIVPQYSPERLTEQVHVVGDADRAHVIGMSRPAQGDGQQAGVLAGALGPAVLGLLGEIGDRAILAEPAVAEVAEARFGRPVVLQSRAQGLLQAASSGWNVAQFDLAARVRGQRWSYVRQLASQLARAPQWRAARWSLLVLVLVNLAGLNAWALQVRHSLQQQSVQIRGVLTQTFKSIPVVVDAPAQMARQLQDLQRSRGALDGSALEGLINQLAAAAPPGFQVTALDYVAGRLQVTATMLGAAEQAQLIAALQARGVSARWQAGRWQLQQEASL